MVNVAPPIGRYDGLKADGKRRTPEGLGSVSIKASDPAPWMWCTVIEDGIRERCAFRCIAYRGAAVCLQRMYLTWVAEQ